MLQQVDRTNFSHRRLHIFQRHNQVHVHLSLNVGTKANSLLHVLQYLQSYQIVSQTVNPIIANCFLLSSCTGIDVLASLIDQQQHRLLQLSMASLWSERFFLSFFLLREWVVIATTNTAASSSIQSNTSLMRRERRGGWIESCGLSILLHKYLYLMDIFGKNTAVSRVISSLLTRSHGHICIWFSFSWTSSLKN